jgi:phenylpropionate dioxygenase-like ring-hydroxylating dioxygenase large terminal subunit
MAWQKVASLDALRDGGVLGIDVDGTDIALFRMGDEVLATDGICTHAHASLADGFVEGDTIECPLHQALFHIRTGKALCGPATEDLKIYPVKVEGADVLIDLQDTDPASEPIPADRSAEAGGRERPSGAGQERAGNGASEIRKMDNNGHLLSKQYVWPGDDLTVIPDWVYTDQEIYRREVERIFHGPTWNYVALEAEVEKPGDFIRSNVGPTPVVVARADDGSINVFENRCMHRAAEFCRELSGTAKEFVCPYHQWTYDLKGNLIGVPFRRGIGGKGGMPADFRNEDHGLRQLNVTTHRGVVFASYSDDTEPFADYLGPEVLREFEATFDGRKLKVLGHYRHSLPGNWKLYHENLKDPYHATLLHTFLVTFGLMVAGARSLMLADASGRHGVMAAAKSDAKLVSSDAKKEMRAFKEGMTLREPRFMDFIEEFDSPWSVTMATIWPNLIVQREMNTLGIRQIVPTGPHEFIMKWTMFGFEGDDEEMTRHRLRQGNLMGPAGFLGLEDNEAIKFVQDGMQRVPDGEHLVKLDPATPAGTADNLISEAAIRAMYKHWRQEMGL